MANRSYTQAEVDEAHAALKKHGTKTKAAAALGLPLSTFRDRLDAVVRAAPPRELASALKDVPDADPALRDRIYELEQLLKSRSGSQLNEEYIKRKIIGLGEDLEIAKPPKWVVTAAKGKGLPGVPTLFCSDWHWGETVFKTQLNGVNEFNMEVARGRARRLIETTVNLLRNYTVNPRYPGIICVLGGDMLTGDIHEELTETNDAPTAVALLDIYEVLIWCVTTLADTFGNVYLPCVAGNHGRFTKKPRSKNRAFTNYDWLLYQFLAKHFAGDKRVQFMIPDGPDASYTVYGHRYLLTHGDQFRGGDGQIGALGPITRGNKRKQTRNSQIDMGYDTMLLGHWHQWIPMLDQIVNGCFPAGALVATPHGVRAIEEVAVGDAVLSRDGTTQKVAHCFERLSEQGLVHLKVRGVADPLTTTPNHLVWAVKAETKRCAYVGAKWDALRGGADMPQWIPADFISPGDYVHIPRSTGRAAPVEDETAWAYGLYIAEGSTLLNGGSSGAHNRICLTMHERELPVLQRFARWFEQAYGVQPRVYQRRKVGGGVTSEFVVSPGREVCTAFRDMFGHRAGGKRLPSGALQWTPALGAALIRGWLDGDGHTTADGTTSGTTISRVLAHQLFRLALNAGMKPSLAVLAAGGPRKSDSYTVHFNSGQEAVEIGGELFYRVHARYRDAQCVPVFDLEVSGEHTYVVDHVGVHNSLKGYDEYANTNNFGYQLPIQGLWMTHHKWGITQTWPIYLEERDEALRNEQWVSWKAPK